MSRRGSRRVRSGPPYRETPGRTSAGGLSRPVAPKPSGVPGRGTCPRSVVERAGMLIELWVATTCAHLSVPGAVCGVYWRMPWAHGNPRDFSQGVGGNGASVPGRELVSWTAHSR